MLTPVSDLPDQCKQRIDQQVRYIDQADIPDFENICASVQQVVRRLRSIQRSAGMGFRFHLLMERDLCYNSSQQPSPALRYSDTDTKQVGTMILFSPTMSCDCPLSKICYEQLCDKVHTFYLQSINRKDIYQNEIVVQSESKRTHSYMMNGTFVQQTIIPSPLVTSIPVTTHFNSTPPPPPNSAASHPPQTAVSDPSPSPTPVPVPTSNPAPAPVLATNRIDPAASYDDLPSFVSVKYPDWFPRIHTNPKAEMPTDLEEFVEKGTLHVEPVYYGRFKNLSQEDTIAAYRIFVKILHTASRQEFKDNQARLLTDKFEYLPFTPPWMRQTLQCENAMSIVGPDSVPRLRGEKTKYGRRKFGLVLAAFYQHEHETFRYVIDYIIDNITVLGEKLRISMMQRWKNRGQNKNSLQALNVTPSTAVVGAAAGATEAAETAITQQPNTSQNQIARHDHHQHNQQSRQENDEDDEDNINNNEHYQQQQISSNHRNAQLTIGHSSEEDVAIIERLNTDQNKNVQTIPGPVSRAPGRSQAPSQLHDLQPPSSTRAEATADGETISSASQGKENDSQCDDTANSNYNDTS